MNAIVIVGVFSALAAAGAFALLLPLMPGARDTGARMPWSALAVAFAAAVIVVVVGRQLGAASLEFLIGVSAFALPVLVLLRAAAVASGGGRLVRWIVLLVWGLVVFPVALLVPLLATADCLAPDCGFEDFGGALPLVVAAAAFVLLTGLLAAKRGRWEPVWPSTRRTVVAIGLLWLASVVWLVHLEGTIDDYTARIALAAVVVPAASGIGWLVFDRLRNVPRSILRSVVLGLAVGIVAVVPGAVSVGMPWSLMTGLLAGASAALVFAASERLVVGYATRWGLAVLAAIAIGFLAPALCGDAVGLIFTARASVLAVPLLVWVAVAVFSAAVSVPVWVLARRRAVDE